jgi:hypothetical protein
MVGPTLNPGRGHRGPNLVCTDVEQKCNNYNESETWYLTLREEHRLRVFENRVLRRMFGPKRDDVIRGWRKLHNEGLHNLYSSSNANYNDQVKRWAGHVARRGRRGMHTGFWWESRKERDH